MSWGTYANRVHTVGPSRREAAFKREVRFLRQTMETSLSYHTLTIDGIERELAVLNSDNLNEKTLCSMPGETIKHGGLVYWMDNHWLVTELDANNELYTKAKMEQCNYLLRWVAPDLETGEPTVIERWCIIEDGTKYLTGEYGDNQFVITRGDSRIAMTIAKDPYSINLNRTNRFLIDDYDSANVLAYRLTKPFKLGGSFNGEGVLRFVLQEVATEDTDNFELHVADYYTYFPRHEAGDDTGDTTFDPAEDVTGRRVLL